jgi:HD-GYP domain-containing protein (c-di-GMP phosphodiesterase class II)
MRSELWSNVLFETLNEATLILDVNFQIVAMNPAAEALFEVSSTDSLGRGIKFLTGREIPSSEVRQSRDLLLRGDVLRGRAWYQKPNTKRFRAEFVAKAVLSSSIPNNQKLTAAVIARHLEGVVLTVHDVTETEARDSRQDLLAGILQSLTDAESLEQIYAVVFEALTGEHGVDSVVLRQKQTDGYRLVASRGSYQAAEIATFQPHTEAAWLRDETTTLVLSAETADYFTQPMVEAGFQYAVGVGQRTGIRLMGSLTLVYRQQPVIDLQPILPQIAAAIGTQLERGRERIALEALAGANRAMREATNQSELYQSVVDFALQTTHCTTASVVMYHSEQNMLEVMAAAGENASRFVGLTMPRGRGLTWQVIDNGQVRLSSLNDPGVREQAVTVREIKSGLYVGIPLRETQTDGSSRVIGAITADTMSDNYQFTSSDIERLKAMSESLSIARSRILALEAVRERAAAFAQLAQLSSDLERLDDPTDIAGRGLETLLNLSGLDSVGYLQYQSSGLSILAKLGETPSAFLKAFESFKLGSETTLFQTVIAQGRVIIVHDYPNSPYLLPQFAGLGLRTIVLAPVYLNTVVHGFIAGVSFGTSRVLPEHFNEVTEFLVGRISRAIERAEYLNEIMHTREASFRTLGRALELRDFETKGHTDRVMELSLELGQVLGLNQTQMQALAWGAYLHDIGKIAVPDSILLKNGTLTPEEWAVIREHPERGFEILKDLNFLPLETLEIVLYHQERLNGSGYPEARVGDDIPFLARLFAVVDVYDALTSERPYKAAWTHEEAMLELHRQAGKTLDKSLIVAFEQSLEKNLTRA